MNVPRHLRILSCFARNGLVREMSFRVNFFITLASEIAWLGMMLIFVNVIFRNTSSVDTWSYPQYLFLLGTHFLITSIFESLFFTNMQRLSEQIRSGGLDFVLLKPVSTQFLVSLERIDYASLANAPLGIGLCVYAALSLHAHIGAVEVLLFCVLIASGVTTLYALMFMFNTTAVWFIRQTSASHLWFYMTSCSKYPAEIYQPLARGTLWFALTFIVPVLIVANLPANVMVRTFEPWLVGYALAAALILVVASWLFFRWALRWYRSASS